MPFNLPGRDKISLYGLAAQDGNLRQAAQMLLLQLAEDGVIALSSDSVKRAENSPINPEDNEFLRLLFGSNLVRNYNVDAKNSPQIHCKKVNGLAFKRLQSQGWLARRKRIPVFSTLIGILTGILALACLVDCFIGRQDYLVAFYGIVMAVTSVIAFTSGSYSLEDPAWVILNRTIPDLYKNGTPDDWQKNIALVPIMTCDPNERIRIVAAAYANRSLPKWWLTKGEDSTEFAQQLWQVLNQVTLNVS